MSSQQKSPPKREVEYYRNLPEWPNFDIYDKNVDGLIPSTRLENWEQFHELVKQYHKDEDGGEYVFRGQHHYKWKLQPTLDRLASAAITEDIAEKQLRNFKLSIRGRIPDNAILQEEDEELWAIGQHHGLATPLLDWSQAPYVALFFSFVNEDESTWVDDDEAPNNHSRVIYVLNKTFLEDLARDGDPISNNHPKIVEPSKDDHGRLVNQAGLFTLAPYGETIESSLFKALVDSEEDIDDPAVVAKFLCKIHIPNSSTFRRECLRHLRKMNIHHASLFPDLIGASGYCNELISETVNRSKYANLSAKLPTTSITRVDIAIPTVSSQTKKDYAISETDTTLRELIASLYIDKRVHKTVPESFLRKAAQTAIAFIEDSAGVDWYVRESQISRLKIILRRTLKQINFPDDLIDFGAQSLTQCIACMSFKKELLGNQLVGEALGNSQADIFKEIWGIDIVTLPVKKVARKTAKKATKKTVVKKATRKRKK